ncbi:hypothetical protein [Methanopyrus sp.]
MIPTHSRAALAYILAELGINVGVDSEVMNEILRITDGNVPFIIDESVHVEEFEDAVMECNVRDMLSEFRDVIGFIMELIVVVPYDLLYENPDIVNILPTIVLVDGTEDFSISNVNTEVSLLIPNEKNIVYVNSKGAMIIDYYDFQYIKGLPAWIGLQDIFKHEYRFDEDRVRDVQKIIESSNNPSVSAIQELMGLPRFGVLIDLFLLERMEGTIVRDRVNIVNETDGVSVSIREHVPAREVVEILAEESTLSERDLSEVVSTLLTSSERFVPVDELERKVRIGEGKLRRVLSTLTRVKALSFQFDLKMPAI